MKAAIRLMNLVIRQCCRAILLAVISGGVHAAGSWLDHPVNDTATGIWSRRNQRTLQELAVIGVAGGALWEGADTRWGRTFWQSADSILLGQASYAAVNAATGRLRPSQSPDPNQWFKHGHSFPSGEVTLVSSAVAPFVFEYGPEHPAVYALELLPAYDAVARVKSRAHWQSDVIAGWALGTGVGYYMHARAIPLTVQVLPRGLSIGWRHRF